jgi:hypothetical protein
MTKTFLEKCQSFSVLVDLTVEEINGNFVMEVFFNIRV